ncbi:ankyrin-1 [Penicillium tannophilum]|nr:ankyrin-1 [Penicillium tannophilum]
MDSSFGLTIRAAPAKLEDTYQRNWIRILKRPERERNRAISILRWIMFSLRLLKVQELVEALLISEDCDNVVVNEALDYIDAVFVSKGILSYYGSLLNIRNHEGEHGIGLGTVHLAYFTVKQYLFGNISAQGPFLQLNNAPKFFMELDEHTLLAKMCLRYLNCLEVWQVNPSLKERPSHGLFLNYAAES